jgi:hypothetical protein
MPTLNPYVKSKQKPACHARTCAYCGEPFVAHSVDKKYCKNACKVAANRKYKPRLISAAEVRRLEGLSNYTRTERKQQTDDTDVLKSLAASLSPDVLAICLEVRAQNSRKHQPAARVGAGD